MKFEYIYIDKEDDVSKIVEKILDSKSDNCILFIPDDADVTDSIVNFKLILREAKAGKKNIFLNSDSDEIKKMAEKAGFTVVEYQGNKKSKNKRKGPSFILDISPPKKEESNKKRTTDKKKAEKDEEGDDVDEIDDDKDKKSRGKRKKMEDIRDEYSSRKSRKMSEAKNGGWKMKKVIAVVILLFIVIFFPFYLFTKADVTVISEKYIFEAQEAVLTSPNIKEVEKERFRMPARYLEFEREINQEFKSSGKNYVEAKAKGMIKIYNAYSSKSQILVATTRFLSESGKLFRLIERTTIPGAKLENGEIVPSHIEAEVMADEAGDEFNIEASEFSIPGFDGTVREGKFYGESESPMTGGFIGEANIISKSDIVNARNELSELVEISLGEEIRSKLGDDYELLSDAKELIIESLEFDKEEGDVGDSFKGGIKAKLRLMAFSKKGIEDIFKYQSQMAISELEGKELIVSECDYGAPRIDFDTNQLSFPVKVKMTFRDPIDSDFLRDSISGMSLDGAKEFFMEQEGIRQVDIKIAPGISPILPLRNNNIDIILN